MRPLLFHLDKTTAIHPPRTVTPPVRHALAMIARDMAKVFGVPPSPDNHGAGSRIAIEYAQPGDAIAGRPEAFAIRFSQGPAGLEMRLAGADDLGLVYGLLHMSREYLGVDPFWFWADREPQPRRTVSVPAEEYVSPAPRVRYRGWFINDEVCLIGWTDAYPPPKEAWQPVFETLLRLGGNMVVPGTDLPRDGVHLDLASEMGLWLTHHHAEPLGAEMFLRAHPDKEANYDKNGPLFEEIWRQAVMRNKEKKTVWILGLRGQGDAPFWENDPSYATPQSRAEPINRAIARQYEIVREIVPDPVCATYLYGELTELYRAGHLRLPEGVIKIWADNGYGRMVSRRQGNDNPRVPSLPAADDPGPHGLYYHVTFHDLQASSHLTPLGNPPEFVAEELEAAFRSGADRYLLVNCGNIRPHLYLLDIAAELWRGGRVDPGRQASAFGRRFFPSAPERAMACYRRYFEAAIRYGPHADDRAGEEFYHHPCREMIAHWLQGRGEEPESSLIWAAGVRPFAEQVRWFGEICAEGLPRWEELHRECLAVLALLEGEDGVFFRDNLILPVELHLSGCRGLLRFCRSYEAYRAGDYPRAFVRVSAAIRDYSAGLKAMAEAEHGKWRNFYRADWLTNVRCTIYALESLRRYLRVLGDGPLFFTWYKRYVIPENERGIMLENTQRRVVPDDELAEMLRKTMPEEEAGY